MPEKPGPKCNMITAILGYSESYHDSLVVRMFNLLCEHPHGLTSTEIMDKLYADRVDGGPLWNSVNVRVHRFNQLARKHGLGLRIACRAGDKRCTRGANQRYCIWVIR